MHVHQFKALAAIAGAATLVVAATSAAQAGGWHHHDHETIHKVVDLSGPRGVDSIVPVVTLVAEDNGTSSSSSCTGNEPMSSNTHGQPGVPRERK